MRRGLAIIESISLHPCGTPVMQLSCPRGLMLGPGQAVLAHQPGSQEPLRHPLFPVHVDDQGFSAHMPDGVEWAPGSRLDLWGPLARGFQPPLACSRWLLLCHGAWSGALLSLIQLGLGRSCAIALQAKDHPPDLPKEVEVISDLPPAIPWADYLAAEVAIDDLPALHQALPTSEGTVVPQVAEVLVHTTLPCGFGACGACAVPMHRGWRLACLEGPVFDLKMLGW